MGTDGTEYSECSRFTWNYVRMGISNLRGQKPLPIKNRVVLVLRTFNDVLAHSNCAINTV